MSGTSTADITASVNGEQIDKLHLDWGESTQINISLPTGSAEIAENAQLHLHLNPNLQTLQTSTAYSLTGSDFLRETTEDIVETVFYASSYGPSMYGTESSASSIFNTNGDEVHAYVVKTISGGYNYFENPVVIIAEENNGYFSLDATIELPSVPSPVGESYVGHHLIQQHVDSTDFSIMSNIDYGGKWLVSTFSENQNASYELSDTSFLQIGPTFPTFEVFVGADSKGVFTKLTMIFTMLLQMGNINMFLIR